jgi:hypothetical protein
MVTHTFNPSTRQISEFEASLVYKDSQDYTEKPCLEKPKKKKKKKERKKCLVAKLMLLFFF